MATVTDARRSRLPYAARADGSAGVSIDASRQDLRAVRAALNKALVEGEVVLSGAAHLHGLLAGLSEGQVTIQGDAGDYLAVLNSGATIRVLGDAGRYLADNMTRGLVIVEGKAGDAAAPYCYGGTVVVRGDAGDFAAVMNKGATILVGGSVGNDVATYMLAGDVIIVGDAGKNLGNYLIRGNIYVGGTWRSLGHNTRVEDMDEADWDKLGAYFEEYGIRANPKDFRKIERLSEKPFYKAKASASVTRPAT